MDQSDQFALTAGWRGAQMMFAGYFSSLLLSPFQTVLTFLIRMQDAKERKKTGAMLGVALRK